MVLTGHEIIAVLTALAVSGVLASVIGQGVKKTLGLKTDSVIHTMILAVSTVLGYAQYIMQVHSKLPPEVLGISVSAIYGVSQIVFKYASYATNFLTDVQAAADAPAPATSTTIINNAAAVPTPSVTTPEADF